VTDPRRPDLRDERTDDCDERPRDASVEGAEEQSQQSRGRGLTAEELERVLQRYPGDLW
jgi:hypothetical protein